MQQKIDAFDECARALREIHMTGHYSPQNKEGLRKGRDAIFAIIAELAQSAQGEDRGFKGRARSAMKQIKPHIDYSISDLLIRDLAAMSYALRIAIQEDIPIEPRRMPGLTFFCEHMIDVMLDA